MKSDIDLKQLASYLDTMQTRKRVLLFIIVNTVVILFSILVLFRPVNLMLEKAYKQLENKQQTAKKISQEADIFKATFSPDPNILIQKKISYLKSKLQEIDPALLNINKALTAPDEMLPIIKSIVKRMKNLKLIALENIKPEIFVEAKPGLLGGSTLLSYSTPGHKRIYQHGIKLEIEGSYWNLLNFLEQLEKIPKKVLWGQLKLTAKKYPISKCEIIFYTLSLNSDWVRM